MLLLGVPLQIQNVLKIHENFSGAGRLSNPQLHIASINVISYFSPHRKQKMKNFRGKCAFFIFFNNFKENFWKITPNFRASPNRKILFRPWKTHPQTLMDPLNRIILHALLLDRIEDPEFFRICYFFARDLRQMRLFYDSPSLTKKNR